jgi:tetratricopeptide (TPR) repeat protein
MDDRLDELIAAALVAEDAYEADPNRAGLDRLIEHWDAVLADPGLRSLGHSTCTAVAGSAANALLHRYQQTGADTDLERAIVLYREAIATAQAAGALDGGDLSNLGNALVARHERRGGVDDLTDAVALYEAAVSITTPNDPARPGRLTNLANAQMGLYESGDPGRLDVALETFERALAAAATGTAAWAGCAANLAAGLQARYERDGSAAELERLIAIAAAAVEATPSSSPELPLRLNTVAAALLSRYAASGVGADLDHAIALLQRATEALRAGSLARPGVMSNLGNAMLARYGHSGRLSDLADAIDSLEVAVAATPHTAPIRARWLNNLASALNARYEARGEIGDLERAATLAQAAVDALPPASPDQPAQLTNLANALAALFERAHEASTLGEAIDHLRRAATLAPADGRERRIILSNLGYALQVRYQYGGSGGDLDAAVTAYRQALDGLPADDPLRWRFFGNLGGALQLRSELTQSDDLDEAIACYRAFVDHAPRESSDRPIALSNLAHGLESRYQRFRDPAALAAAVALYRESCADGVRLRPGVFLVIARRWGSWATGRLDWAEATEALDCARDCLTEVVRAQLLRSHKESWLGDARDLAGQAALAAARAGDHRHAALAFEETRAVLFSEALERDRATLEGLARSGRGELVDRYRAAAARLAALERRIDPPNLDAEAA